MSLPGMTTFLEACGATGPLVLEFTSSQDPVPAACVLHQPFAVIGRAPHADLALPGSAMSLRHAYVQVLDGRAFLLDLDSRTGVSLDGVRVAEEPIDPPASATRATDTIIQTKPRASGKPRTTVGPLGKGTWLSRGQSVGVGAFTVCVKEGVPEQPIRSPFGPGDSNPLAAQTLEAPGLPAVGLSFAKDGVEKGAWMMNCRLALLGRSPLCRVQLTGSSVSWIHCGLVRTPAGLWVVDLLGREGIKLNGRQVRYGPLQAGDRLQVGRFEVAIVGQAARLAQTVDAGTFVADFPQAVPPMISEGLQGNGIELPLSFSDSFLDPIATAPDHVADEFPQDPRPAAGASESGFLPPALRPSQAMVAFPESSVGFPAVESLSESLLQRFESMQHQMVDEFHQAMTNMVQVFGKMQQEEIAQRYGDLNEMRQEQLTHIQRDLKDLRQEETEQLHLQLKALREQEQSQIHEGLKELREQETARVHERLQELRDEERTHIQDRLKEMREEERGQIHAGLKALREEETARIQERLQELRQEEQLRVEERLKQLRDEERGQIHEGLKDLRTQEIAQIQERLKELRQEESGQIQESLKQMREEDRRRSEELRESERVQVQEGLKDLRQKEMAQIQEQLKGLLQEERGEMQESLKQIREEDIGRLRERLADLHDEERSHMDQELKGLREEHRTHIQEMVKGLREEEMAWVQQGLNQLREEERTQIHKELEGLHELSRKLEEMRSQLAAAQLRTPAAVATEPRPEGPAIHPGTGTMDEVAAYLTPRQRASVNAPTPLPRTPSFAPDAPVGRVTDSVAAALAQPRVTPDGVPLDPPMDPEQKYQQAELSLRIAALQDERQSLWRKIVGMLHGGGGER